jgi:hypothetical protein
MSWTPPPGWCPDPNWPRPPTKHHFWRRTKYGQRRRSVAALLVALPVLLIGGCITYGLSTGDPCFFDLPPGDVTDIRVVNDTAATVVLFDCDDKSCLTGFNSDTVPAHASVPRNYEQCTGAALGVTDSGTGALLGCLAYPTGQPPPVDHLDVSSQTRAGGCAATSPTPVTPYTHEHGR